VPSVKKKDPNPVIKQEKTIEKVDVTEADEESKFPPNQPRLIYNPDLDVKNLKEGQIVKLNKLHFNANAYKVKEESYPVLDEIFQFLATNKSIRIEVGGHTNGLPPHSFCDDLSRNRAYEVRKYLTDKGIPKDQIIAHGYGKRKPIASNANKQGREANQRVEIKILSLK